MIGKIIKSSNCGVTLDVSEGANKFFCLYCGTPNLLTDVMEIPGVELKCLSCGSKNKDEAVYCSKCGANLQKKRPFCKEMHTHDTIFCSKTGCNIKEQENKRQRELEELMVLISGGTFLMGSNNGSNDEKPVHSVTVSGFYMGKYEVTNREFCLFDSSHDNPGDDLPVVNVNWNHAVNYCKWLSEKTGKNYRLPTEAEWEYACKAGTTTEYYWGNEMDGSYCWHYDNSGAGVHPVGQKRLNGFGLYDMSGNVWEWCSDWYGNYSSGSVNNPTGSKSASARVTRGGSCFSIASSCHSAIRGRCAPGYSSGFLGFRLISEVSDVKTIVP